jgi:2-amino-4-hydroxy-6-hydroxymethyldihydropteridine diphosphokinase
VAQALLGLGGNVGDVRATLDEAVRRFADGVAVKLIARSSDYRTPPWGVTDQPPFINCAIAVETALPPRALLDHALAVERALGRDRTRELRWGPRAVDLDLLAYDNVEMNELDLVLPHPRLFERAFVLIPLAEIAPDRVIGGRRIADAAASIDTTDIERLPAPGS